MEQDDSDQAGCSQSWAHRLTTQQALHVRVLDQLRGGARILDYDGRQNSLGGALSSLLHSRFPLGGDRVASSIVAVVAGLCVGVTSVGEPRVAAALGIGSLCLVAAFIRPGFLCVGILMWLPVEGFAAKLVDNGGILLLSDVALLSLVAVCVARVALARRGQVEGRLRPLWVGGVLAAAAALSWVANDSPTMDTAYWLRVYVRFLPIAVLCAWPDVAHDFRKALPFAAAYTVVSQGIVAIAELVGGIPVASFFWPGQFSVGGVATQAETLATVGTRFVSGTAGHYNIFGILMCLCAAVLLADLATLATEMSRTKRRARSAVLAFAAACILLSQSRQALIIAVVFLLVVVIMTLGGRVRIAVPVMVGTAFATSAVALVASQRFLELRERLAVLLSSQYWSGAGVSQNRGYALDEVAKAVWTHAPLLGIGPGSFSSIGGGGRARGGCSSGAES